MNRSRLLKIPESGLHLEPLAGLDANKVMGPLVNRDPLPHGDVRVFALEHLDRLPRQISVEALTIQVLSSDGSLLHERTAIGRSGCLAIYEELIGYDPSEETPVVTIEDDHALLCSVCELLYRTVCEDFN